MKVTKLSQMKGGWFIGDFTPSLHQTNSFEVAVKNYKKGDKEKSHYHKIATEFTVIVKGTAQMNDRIYNEGDIIQIEPGESTDFIALTDVITSVVKVPSVKEDKYIKE